MSARTSRLAPPPPGSVAHGTLSRRRLLALGGTAALGGLLAACGGSDNDESGSSGPTGTTGSTGDSSGSSGETGEGFTVVQRYPSGRSLVPGDIRLAISLARSNGSLMTDGPDVLTGVMRNDRGERVETIAAERRGTGLDVPYWSITSTIATAGLYDFVLDGATGDPTPFFVYEPAEVTLPVPGAVLPPFDTPTTSDARGVDPVCTRLDGPCPFHEVTLTEALAAGKPVVYLIGTPAHCATATCGPGLDFLIEAAGTYGDRVTFVHAEVYADPEATEVAPAVTEFGLEYEPVMWIADATGTVVRRIDIVWDAKELGQMLAESLGDA